MTIFRPCFSEGHTRCWFSEVHPCIFLMIFMGVCVCVYVYVCVSVWCCSSLSLLRVFNLFPASFTQRLRHRSSIQLIAGQRLLADRQGLLLDLCVIKYLFGKIHWGILDRNGVNSLLRWRKKIYFSLVLNAFFHNEACLLLPYASPGIVSVSTYVSVVYLCD